MNQQLGIYPKANDPEFLNKIAIKKEFYDFRISNRNKDIYCLEPQQKFLSNFINPLTDYNSLLVYHSVGVGKTLTAISIAENFKEYYRIIVVIKNKNLKFNFIKELTGGCSNYFKTRQEFLAYHDTTHENHRIVTLEVNAMINKHYSFYTYGDIVNASKGISPLNLSNSVLIVDEVHNVTGNDTYIAMMKLLGKASNVKRVLLSATPVYDNIREIFEIANLLGNNLPIRKDLIKQALVVNEEPQSTSLRAKKPISLLNESVDHLTKKGLDTILNALKGKVSYLIADPLFFPKRNYIGSPISSKKGSLIIYPSKMSSFQQAAYNETLVKSKELNALFNNSSNAMTMVYPDSTYGRDGFIKNIEKGKNKDFLKLENLKKYSSKLYSIVNLLQESPGPAFIYSNYVNDGGTSLVKEVLIANGYSPYGANNDKPKFITFDDNVSPTKKLRLLYIFNNNSNAYGKNIKVIIGSPVVSEGITFKNIRQIHILEPYWNLSRIEQIIGRGVRFNSHKALPEDQRNTQIYLHTAMLSSGKSIDYLKYSLAEEKDLVIKDLEYNLKKIAIDCSSNKSRNQLKAVNDYSRDCQYKVCSYKCENSNVSQKNTQLVDTSTYSLKQHDIEMYKFILKSIRELYKIGFVYDLKAIVTFIQNKNKSVVKENIYYVLDDIISIPINMKNTFGEIGNIVPVGDYYLFTGENSDEPEPLFNKIYKVERTNKNLRQVLGVKESATKKRQAIVQIPKGIFNEPVFGSYIDKQGYNDKKFRIIQQNIKQKSSDKRKLTTGKVCMTHHIDELQEISKKLKIPYKETFTKTDYCSAIESTLNKSGKIIK